MITSIQIQNKQMFCFLTSISFSRWSQTSNPDSVLKENVEYVEDSVSENQLTTTVSKDCQTDWTFLIKTTKILRAVALLQYSDRNRFSIKYVLIAELILTVSACFPIILSNLLSACAP